MSEIIVNMSVSIPNEIYKEFLTGLVRDDSVAVEFSGHSLLLSMPDIEPLRTPHDGNMSQDELDTRDAFYKSLNFVQSLKLRDGELDAGREDTDIKKIANPLILKWTKNIRDIEGEIKSHQTPAVCMCGHWIGIVGTKWQHMDGELVTYPTCKMEIHYRERCYGCDCIDPKPAEEYNATIRR